MGIDRRTFLTRAGVTAAGAWLAPTLLAGCSTTPDQSASGGSAGTTGTTAARLPSFGDPMLDLPAAQSPIKTVVILMMENRSFDHWLGWMAKDEAYLEAGRRNHGHDFTVDGTHDVSYAGPNGAASPRHLPQLLAGENPWRGCGHPDPGHSWSAGRAQRDGGFLAKDSRNDEFALGYYLAADVPFSAALAKRFTTFDQSHASVLGPTFPNREYLLAAQSGGNKTNALPDLSVGFTWDTIVDRLVKAGVTVGSYATDLPVVGLWGPRMVPYVKKIDDYFIDAKAGTLPNVVFVDPGFTGGNRTDNHPHGDIRAGERFARDVFAGFATSPQWQTGAFVLTYDEWGGFYDHVKPPVLPDSAASADDAENFGQAGFRIPTVLASPFAKPGFVDHAVHDHTSILRFLEWRFLGAPPQGTSGNGWWLTERDHHANNLGASLVTKADPELRFDLDLAIDPPSPPCEEAAATTTTATAATPASVAVGDERKHSFEDARDAGYFESVGIDTEASSLTRHWLHGHGTLV